MLVPLDYIKQIDDDAEGWKSIEEMQRRPPIRSSLIAMALLSYELL